MAYEKHTWTTGETITATKLNNIEDGIAGGGGGLPYYEITTTNFPPSSNNTVGYFYIYKKNGNTYETVDSLYSYGSSLYVYGNITSEWTFINAPVPHIENRYLFFTPGSGVTVTATSGGIASDPVLIDGWPYYQITGDFTITLNGWA